MVTKEQRLKQIEYVVNNSENVKINHDKIIEYTKMLKVNNNTYWLNNDVLDLTEKEFILLMFIIESMNFCFWKEPFIEKTFKNEYHKKSTAMFYSIVDYVINNKEFLNIDRLVGITKEDLKNIFGSKEDLPFISERYCNLVETVTIIYNKKDAFFEELFSFNNDEKLLDYIVSNFPNFNDISEYKGQLVCFYKRATLLVQDLFEVSKTIKANIKNIDNLLGCADYSIPRTLRHYGVLEYSDELANLVDNKKIIEHNSNYEIEIRANMIYALELIKEQLLENNININSILLDNVIWITGRTIDGEHHLTETIFY